MSYYAHEKSPSTMIMAGPEMYAIYRRYCQRGCSKQIRGPFGKLSRLKPEIQDACSNFPRWIGTPKKAPATHKAHSKTLRKMLLGVDLWWPFLGVAKPQENYKACVNYFFFLKVSKAEKMIRTGAFKSHKTTGS